MERFERDIANTLICPRLKEARRTEVNADNTDGNERNQFKATSFYSQKISTAKY
jgi:hypothetical protein